MKSRIEHVDCKASVSLELAALHTQTLTASHWTFPSRVWRVKSCNEYAPLIHPCLFAWPFSRMQCLRIGGEFKQDVTDRRVERTRSLNLCICGHYVFVKRLVLFLFDSASVRRAEHALSTRRTLSFLTHFLSSFIEASYSFSTVFENLRSTSPAASKMRAAAERVFATGTLTGGCG